jgi:hypothetical protein
MRAKYLEGSIGLHEALSTRPPEARLSADTATLVETAGAMLAG